MQGFWAWIIEHRPEGPEAWTEPARPDSPAGWFDTFDDATARLTAALESVDPTEHAWTWSTDQTVGFIGRRQAHEALIHRLDAELTAGTVTDLDPTLAADGVDEVLAMMYGGTPAWGTFTPGDGLLRVDLRETGDSRSGCASVCSPAPTPSRGKAYRRAGPQRRPGPGHRAGRRRQPGRPARWTPGSGSAATTPPISVTGDRDVCDALRGTRRR